MIALAIHGGAGVISKTELSTEQEKAYKLGLEIAIDKGYHVLQNGGSALDAVQASIVELENYPLFNAGKGSVFTNDERNELDASIMCGIDLSCGAVTAVTSLANPILVANAVRLHSPHVLMCGTGAETFAKQMGFEFVSSAYFFTQHRYDALLKAKERDIIARDHDIHVKTRGTVGAVALDSKGNLAAGTSTGGLTNKRFGRIGDSPIIGAGTYADNKFAAISCTGHGEDFIRHVVAYDVIAQMKYGSKSLTESALHTIAQLPSDCGGLIAIDKNGNICMPFNTEGMYRACVSSNSENEILIH